ncbi:MULTISPECIES: SDR family oxidoreductase [unclassified Nocardioides]|uniref:SDR family oxidoreductase n=1 Tax=unclassified Nocardioides TaxID=2615069 RepID=UPI0006F85050|nr:MULTISPECIES: SDR family oxidoreductase [unclassified Nocardioides]KRA38162.1 NAD-dependent dehydratase [Nocardioides sp. Root614]KRA92122.1 NAD-dependent dehydratase [Nocardioides sp. Root682]
MRIAIVGGNGQISRLLHPVLVAGGHQPVALVRNEGHRAGLEALGAEVRLLDIENQDVDDFAAAFEGCDAVVFSAGGGPDGNIERKRTVDLEGALKSMTAAEQRDIRRFVQVSAINVDEPVAPDAGEVWAAYVAAKRDADVALRASNLDWTILRPGLLTDEPPTGLVALGPDVPRGAVTRADVAAVLGAVIDRDDTIGQQWNLVGGDLSISAAIDAAIDAAVDRAVGG